ncbi:hypothetical protein NE562_00495 [Butyricicoccus faecihominis]|uniref:hypothetical protein n=1 Tax=Butyricicoccus faecihominis TaxID=1712515 RepID=UPI00247B2A52|nr:hypothetical protein [Butyricicoccus faecihominis]MCQ5128121.1 hypothetical protein [Butyricicoccus faecihominis]
MTSKHSFSEGALLCDGLRRNLWCVVLSTLGFLMTLTLPVLMLMQRALERQKQIAEGLLGTADAAIYWQNALDDVGRMIGGYNPLLKLMFLVLAVVCGVAAYSYLHSRQRVDFYHALPISRTRQFFNRFVIGILYVVPVYLIVLALTLGCTSAMGFGEAIRWSYIGSTIVSMLVIFIVVYALSALSAILCGNTIISLLLLIWFLFGPAVIGALKINLCRMFFGTYAYSVMDSTMALRLSPALQSFAFDGLQYSSASDAAGLSAGALHGVYLLVAVLATLLCLFLYRIRKSERSGLALAFEPLKTPLKIVMCLIMGLAAGLVFQAISGGFWFWPGLIIGAVLFHFLIEIIYAFDFHAIFKKPIHLAVILLVLVGFCLLLRADVIGYDHYLPAEDKIAAVDLNAGTPPALKTAENISAVRRIAEMGVEVVDTVEEMKKAAYGEDDGPRFDYVTISYQLTNGHIVNRAYTIPLTEELTALQRQVTSSAEYKQCKWELFTYDPAGATGKEQAAIEVINEQGTGTQGVIFEAEQVQQVLDTLREEVLSRTDTSVPTLCLNLGYQEKWEDGRSYVEHAGCATVTRADTKTLALIEKFTGITPQPLTVDDVRLIEISPLTEETWQADVTDPTDVAQMLKDAVNIEIFRMWNSDDSIETAFDKVTDVRVVAVSKRGNNYFVLRYPLGKTPTALIEAYSATAKAAQPEDNLRMDGEIAAEPALPW